MRVSSHRLREHVEALAAGVGERNVFRPGSLDAAAEYIEAQWRALGCAVLRQPCAGYGVPCANLEVRCGAARSAAGAIVVGAHYDTVRGSPGADDNASGVAVLLELTRLLLARRPAGPVHLVSFVNEEPPFFIRGDTGSAVWARAARRRGAHIRVMLALEMLGCFDDTPGNQRYPPLLGRFYPDRGDFIAFVSNLRSRRELQHVVAAFRANSDFPLQRLAAPAIVPGLSWSDHRSFWRAGFRALMVTDTAFYRYPWYHTARDTPDRLDYVRMAAVASGLAGAILALSGAPAGAGPAAPGAR